MIDAPRMTASEQRTDDLFKHASYLRLVHGWTAAETIEAMKYYAGHTSIEQLRAACPARAEEIILVR